MDKLITSLDTNLGPVLREQLDSNFQKIQNGVDGQSDVLNKQITDLLGDVAPQDQNEVTQSRIDVHGNTYGTLKSREDATQATAETALSEERDTSVEVKDARTNSNSHTYSTLKERLDSQENDLDNSINEKLATMRLNPEAFTNEAALRAKYPQGNDQLNVTTDNGHLWIWIDGDFKDCGQFQTAGIDQSLVDQIEEAFEKVNRLPELIDSQPTPANGDTVISTTEYLGQKWFKMTSTANTPFRGVRLLIDDPDKISEMANYPVKINFNIQSSIDQTIGLDFHFYDSNGNDMNNAIIDVISLNASKILNYQKEFSLDSNHIAGVAKVELWMSTSGTNDLGTVLINDYSVVLKYNTNRMLNQLPELIERQPTPNNDTVISTTKYLDLEWTQMTSTANTPYRGLKLWIDDPDKISAMSTYPVKINLNIQSSIDQTLRLDFHFYDKNGNDLGNSISVDRIALNASKILNYQKEFSLGSNHIEGVAKVALWLFTSGTSDLGTVLINDYSAVLDYNTNKTTNQLPELIERQPLPSNNDTVISITKYLGQEWLKMTSTANTQYRGLKFQIDDPDKISAMSTYPVKINLNIQSSIDQTFGLDFHFYDKNGNDLGNSISVDRIALNASKILNYQKEFSLGSNHIEGVAKVELWMSTSGTNDLGTVLINDYSVVLEYGTNETTNGTPITSYDYEQFPEVYLNGSTSGMSGTNYVTMQFKFKDRGREVDGFASTKWQGDSSLVWDKKAYRIKTFEDQSLTKKMNFKPCPLWSADNKYNLKAYYTDPVLCRDVVNANIGTDLWATQKNMPDDLANTEDFGFIDGFPIKVFINDKFAGIYSFNTAKGDYGKNTKAVISGETYTDTTAFSALPTGGVKLDGSDFEMVSPDDPTDEIKQAVNSLITFVSTSSDNDFKTQLGTHIDLESLIDYFIFLNVIENSDADGKNQTLITWDFQKWYFHPYDLDTTYGGEFNGTIRDPLTGLLGLNSHLFTRLNSLFVNEIKSRYRELRTWLTPVYVLKMYRDHINLIGESNYEDEFNLWNNPNHDKNNYDFIKIHVYKRFKLLDSLWLQ
jgi:hypothetical protein